MSKHNFPMHNLKTSRLEQGLCTKCGKNNPMNDNRLGCMDPLCPDCRRKYTKKK